MIGRGGSSFGKELRQLGWSQSVSLWRSSPRRDTLKISIGSQGRPINHNFGASYHPGASLTLSLSLMLLYLVKLLEPELKLNWIGWSVDASLEYLDCADHLRYRGLWYWECLFLSLWYSRAPCLCALCSHKQDWVLNAWSNRFPARNEN